MFDAIFDTRRPIPLIPNYYVSLRAAGALFLDPQNRGRIAVFLWNFVDPLCQFPGHRNPATEKKAPIFEQDIFPRPCNDHGVSIARATLRKEKINCEKITNHSSCQQYIVRFSIVRPKEERPIWSSWTIGLLHQFLKIFGNTLWCLLRCYKLWPRPCSSVIEAWRLHLWKRCWGLMISVHSGVFVRQTVIPLNLSCNRVLRVLTLTRWVPLPSGLEKATKQSAGHTRNKHGGHIGRFAFSFRPNVTRLTRDLERFQKMLVLAALGVEVNI